MGKPKPFSDMFAIVSRHTISKNFLTPGEVPPGRPRSCACMVDGWVGVRNLGMQVAREAKFKAGRQAGGSMGIWVSHDAWAGSSDHNEGGWVSKNFFFQF
ncbi:MAG: hypothetical protein GY820_01245 [Gammaproteobacteria bacterium]|nr:hypothetical protein [Gammaproteobacteria bacterium]